MAKQNKYTIEIVEDTDMENPREWDNLGMLYCEHNRYTLGDDIELDTSQCENWEDTKIALIKKYHALVIVPVYMYDHSSITISLTPFNDRWDSGQVGFMFTTREELWKSMRYKAISPKRREKILELYKSEIEVYDKYLNGEGYAYDIKDAEGDSVESRGVFYSESEAMEVAKESVKDIEARELKEHTAKAKELIKNRVPLLKRPEMLNF